MKDPVEIAYLRVANVQDGRIDLSEIKLVCVSRTDLERYSLATGDVLMTEGGDFDKLGRGFVWEGQISKCLHQNHIFSVRTDRTKLNPYFLSYQAGSVYGKIYFLACAKQSTNLASINSSQLKEFPVLLPELKEQESIVDIVKKWDHAIGLAEKLLIDKQALRTGLMHHLFAGKRHLQGFNKEWETCKLVGYIREVSQRNRTAGIMQVLSITNDKGFVLPEEYFSRSVASSDLANYKVVRRNQFAYNPSRINVGSLALLTNFDEGVISPMYIVFEAINGLDSNYLNYWLSSHEGKYWIKSLAQGSVRNTVSFDALTSIELELPPFDEQCAIVKCLATADREIELLKAKVVALREQKKGLMQQLLTGKKRVTTCTS